jgi:phospholipid/cholesterol/gamma-HCH transport system permease protein
MAAGWLRTAGQGDTALLTAGGDWTLAGFGGLDGELSAALRGIGPGVGRVRLNLHDLDRLDTAGAWLLVKAQRALRARNVDVATEGLDGRWDELLRLAGNVPPEAMPPPPRSVGFHALLERLGEATTGVGREGLQLLSFYGECLTALARAVVQPWRLRIPAICRQMERTGVDAVPIVGLLSFLIGIVLAFQGADQLRRFGAEIFTVNLLGVSILRELGVLLTAIIVAGRSGSAFAAQIGAMQVNQEIDALRTIGVDPIEVLVLPRLIGLMLTLPLLTFFADIMGLLGGGLMVVTFLDIPVVQFLRQLSSAVTPTMLFAGLVKAPVFAFLIAMVGCFQGLSVTGSAESVGQLTTKAVVVSIFLVILVDAVFSIVFTQLGI